MKYRIETDTHTPAYLQLYKQVREDIVNGIYPPGHKLPSKRTLANDCDISVITVEHAYALLCDEGYAESRERSGYFVVFREEDCFASSIAAAISPPQPIHHARGTSPEFPFSVLARTMRTVISNMGPAILDSAPNSGCVALRIAIRDYLARSRGIYADIEQIIIGSGSEYLYTLIVELLGRDKTYGIESPSYEKIELVYGASDVTLERLPMSNDGIDNAALAKCKADVLHISPYRSYPSGVTASASKRHRYLCWAEQPGKWIIEDDFESEFSVSKKPEETLFSHSTADNIIYMNTFSKTISPAFRVGYMILPKGLVPVFSQRLGFYACTVPAYIQYVLAELIQHGDFERHINRVRRVKRRELLLK